jgi:hypothetical protein
MAPSPLISPSFLASLRRSALVGLVASVGGAAGCVPDYGDDDSADSCSDGLTVFAPGEAFDGSSSEILACVEAPSDLQCEDPVDVDGSDIVVHSDSACGYDADVTCGPVVDAVDGACCYAVSIEGEWCAGRPLTVGAEVRQAGAGPAADWCAPAGIDASALSPDQLARLATLWREDAAQEHASVAAFARAALQLMALGAPAALLAGLTRAQGDEVAHARVCYGVAAALDGQARGPGGLDVSGLLDRVDLETVLVDTLVGGAVGETLAAARARAAAEATVDPALAAILHRIAEDEARHAALAWRVARWLLQARPDLGALALRTLGTAPRLPVRSLGVAPTGWGHLSVADAEAVHAAAWRAVVLPVRDALLGVSPPAQPAV